MSSFTFFFKYLFPWLHRRKYLNLFVDFCWFIRHYSKFDNDNDDPSGFRTLHCTPIPYLKGGNEVRKEEYGRFKLDESVVYESAKLRVLCTKIVLTCRHPLLAYVLTCQCVLCAYVLTCQRALSAYVLTCQRTLRTYLFNSQRALHAYVLTCQRVLHAHASRVPTSLECLRAHVPTCLMYLRAQVLTYLSCLGAHILTCLAWLRANLLCVLSSLRALRVNMSRVLIYSRVNVVCKLTCSRATMPWVPCLTLLAWPRNHLPSCFAFLVSGFDTTFFSFTAIGVEAVHTVGKV